MLGSLARSVAYSLVFAFPLARLAMATTTGSIEAGKPILGVFKHSHEPLTKWMASIPDSTPIEAMNIPGTHDAAAWNYTAPDAQWFNCQDKPLFEQLDGGIRLLDLRFGWNNNTGELVFYHASALLSATARMEDIFAGLYHWLKEHPTETLLLSLKVDNGPTDQALQEKMYGLIKNNDHWVQLANKLPTLGHARGKAVLLRRFTWDLLPSTISPSTLPGINLADNWAVNLPDFTISYNPPQDARIEDFYLIDGPNTTQHKVDAKFDATSRHILNATQHADNAGELWISFASAAGIRVNGEFQTPKILAVGDASYPGVNAKLLAFLQSFGHFKTNRLGIVLLDFFASEPDLVEAIIHA